MDRKEAEENDNSGEEDGEAKKSKSIARFRRQETVTEQPRLATERRRDFDRRQSLVRSPKRVRGVVIAGTFTKVGRCQGRGCMKMLRLEGAYEVQGKSGLERTCWPLTAAKQCCVWHC